jgi:hypothetical protein
MRKFKYTVAATLIVGLGLPLTSKAQESSLNTYSPYTMYGLGNLNRSSISSFVGMGGASIGFRNVWNDGSPRGGMDGPGELRINVSNPASLSGLPQRSFTFDFGMAGANVYMSQRLAGEGMVRSSFNTFNFNNMTMAFPLAGNLGFAFTVSPYSEVGYRMHTDDKNYLADVGVVREYHDGQGEINEAKAAVGWEVLRGLSIGAEINYLWGNIDRTYRQQILPHTGSGTYTEISANTNMRVGRLFGAFGLQYTPFSSERNRLTLGATYRMGGALNAAVLDHIPSGNIYGDDVRYHEFRSATHMPQRIGVGAYYHRLRWTVGVDYIFEDWAANNAGDPYINAENEVRYVNTNTMKLGLSYTPNRYDLRGKFGSFFNRVTYKAGLRAGNNYLEFKGRPMPERAVTLGLDIPFKTLTVSTLSVGLEYGERGTMQQGLVKERYFRVNVGVMLFGRDYDYWFEKYKYN